ncbi:MAG: D-xylono/L-arabinono,4-lactonase [Chthoniobacter sp.]|nr:D-xylono/L-arabinono,4-lactonase [Chthoniobacter sp.]
MSNWKITLLANEHCQTGECPVWDEERGCVYWTDIPNGKLFRHDLATRSHEQIYSGPPVGGFTLQTDGSLLLFRIADIAVLPWRGEARSIIDFHAEGSDRFNDVCADPEGRVFAGTLNNQRDKVAGLFRVERDGTVAQLFNGTGNSNGSGFSTDERTFFWTDSTAKQICRFDYDVATGGLSNRTTLVQLPHDQGTPDGLCLDAEDNIWSARWNGAAVFKFSREGTLLDKIAMPVKAISCPCFGGSDSRMMFVTTANGKPGEPTEDGALFQVEGAFDGKPKFRSRILI